MLITLSIVAILIAILFAYFLYKKKENKIETVENNIQSEKDKVSEVYQGLLNINIEIRESGIDKNIILKVENVIDIILNIVEELNKKENFSELTVIVNRMHSKYLPSLLNPFLKLDKKGMNGYKISLLEQLNNIEKELINIKEAVDNKNFGEFEKMSKFIDSMFSNQQKVTV